MEEFDLGLVAAEWKANLLPRERVPELATALLEGGHDTPSLRVAAGLLATELDQAHELFGQALAELGYEGLRNWRGHGEALALEYARRGLDGRMAVQEAVVAIYNLSLRFDDENWSLHSASLTDFIVLADLWEDRPDERQALERDLRERLQWLLNRRAKLRLLRSGESGSQRAPFVRKGLVQEELFDRARDVDRRGV